MMSNECWVLHQLRVREGAKGCERMYERVYHECWLLHHLCVIDRSFHPRTEGRTVELGYAGNRRNGDNGGNY